MRKLTVSGLPSQPLRAAEAFYREWMPQAEAIAVLKHDLLLCFEPCDHTHRAWRIAATQGLARLAAPGRVNAVSAEEAGQERIGAYLANAPGVTGQYLTGDDTGAGDPLTKPS